MDKHTEYRLKSTKTKRKNLLQCQNTPFRTTRSVLISERSTTSSVNGSKSWQNGSKLWQKWFEIVTWYFRIAVFSVIFAHSCLVFCFARVHACVLNHNAVYSKRVPFCDELVTWSNRFVSFKPRNDRQRQSSNFTIQYDVIKLLLNGSKRIGILIWYNLRLKTSDYEESWFNRSRSYGDYRTNPINFQLY